MRMFLKAAMKNRQLPVILALGTTQTLAWASSYYLPAILADPISRDLGISSNWFFAVFSASLVISGLLGPGVGRQIDLVGGRLVLSASNIILAVGLLLLGASTSLWLLAAAWILLGVGMGLGLYDAAFGALVTMPAMPSPASRCSLASQAPSAGRSARGEWIRSDGAGHV